VLVSEGWRLSQIRFRRGQAVLDAEALRALHARERLVEGADADVGEERGSVGESFGLRERSWSGAR